MSLLCSCALTVVIPLLSMEGQRAQKYLNLCSEDVRRSYGFGTTWGWAINDSIFIFGWTIPLKIKVLEWFYVRIYLCFPEVPLKSIPLHKILWTIIRSVFSFNILYRTKKKMFLLKTFHWKVLLKDQKWLFYSFAAKTLIETLPYSLDFVQWNTLF